MKYKINEYSNCLKECPYYFYCDDNNNYHCTNDYNCTEEYPLLDKKECKKSNEKLIEESIKHTSNSINQEEEIKYYDTILKNI